MTYTIDTTRGTIRVEGLDDPVDLYSKAGFELLSGLWLKVGWNEKYTYTFSWMGRPIIQLPEDMVRVQEVIYRVRPDVIIETGVAHGGSLVFYASLCQAMGRGRVIGVDIEIRPHNRRAIESHPLFDRITLFEGSSVDPRIVQQVAALVRPGEVVLVLLDSCHTRAHVREELERYSPLVSVGSYVVVTDGVMRAVADTPRGNPEWTTDNPLEAVAEFVRARPGFVVEQPGWPFNESRLDQNVTHWPQAYLLRRR